MVAISSAPVIPEMKLGLLRLALVISNVLVILVTKPELQQHVPVINSVLVRLVILLIVVVVINNALVRLVIVIVRVIALVYQYVHGTAQQMRQILN